MQGNEDILSNNEDINSSKGDDNDISDIVNDEFYPTAEIQQKNNLENLELDEIEKSLNLLHLQMSKKKKKKIMKKQKINMICYSQNINLFQKNINFI